MNASTQAPNPASTGGSPQDWTCPFCSLLCDGFGVEVRQGSLRLVGSDCSKAVQALAGFDAPRPAPALVDGRPVAAEAALDAAADRLATCRLPLFGGLATDVAGMRALYRLANAGGAILDHARGDALMHVLRALQDRGQMFSTLAEIRNRADLVVCIGTDAATGFPEFFRRSAPVEGAGFARRVVFVGAQPPAAPGLEGLQVQHLDPAGDLFDTVAMLAALVDEHRPPAPDAALADLAQMMRAARYCVVVWEPGRLPPQGALIAEALLRIVMSLNRGTRAGAFILGGADGAQTANAVTTWMSGLPLRTRVGPHGVDHDPLQYATARLLEEGAVDLLLWVASLGPDLGPPATSLPRIVLGHPALAAACGGRGVVFIPVATPGVGAGGHMFRADGVVTLPVRAVRDDGLPTVADVAAALEARLALRRLAAEGTP
ncbi:molybdopterin-binding domain-containing protein [Thauera sinica]|uniref:Formylmethanofuran dehydrogenase n=1 Tax=Thauera sinica TaxID=2665146 RepID=A0ABW1ALK6_9RHOO|nr:formylmethanofuran dehydrogenase [Thauera sp. K11]ATE62653.1 formylmethanofuran dehydrogenase [Thauera sp. K11]